MSEVKLTEISIFPIKSTRGIQLPSAQVTPIGLSHDRTFVLVDEQNNFISQRKYPSMALITSKIIDNTLLISAPGHEEISIPLQLTTGRPISVSIWSDECFGFIADSWVNQWFSQYLDFKVTLVAYNHNKQRATDPDYSSPGDSVSFADGFPLLVISEASLIDLNGRLKNPVTMNSFRPNLVVNNTDAFAEDNWHKLMIGDVEFEAVKKCSRCILTTVDPLTGVKSEDQEPLRTLSHYRREEGGVIFGMNLIPRSSGTIRLGDIIQMI